MRQLLDISSTPIKLDYNTTKGQYNITQTKATCDVQIDRSELSVQPHHIKVKIDRRDMYASMGIYMPDQFRRKTEQEARQDVMDVIAQTGDDARIMAETQGGALVDICRRKAGYDPPDFETAFIPGVKPDINWEDGSKAETDFSPYKVDIKWNIPVKPDVQYTMGKTEISVSQRNKVSISYLGTYDDVAVIGKNLNFQI